MYGSLQNMVMANANAKIPEVGMGATEVLYTDRHAGTIVEVSASGTRLVWQRDIATRTDERGMTDAQSYTYEPDPTARREIFTLRKNGRWVSQGSSMKGGRRLVIGVRNEYYDYSF